MCKSTDYSRNKKIHRSNILWREKLIQNTFGYLPYKIATKTEIIKNINAKVGIVELRKTDVDKNVSENKIKEIKKFIMLLENHPEELQEY